MIHVPKNYIMRVQNIKQNVTKTSTVMHTKFQREQSERATVKRRKRQRESILNAAWQRYHLLQI